MVDGTLGSASSMSSRWWWRGCERLRWWRRRNTIVTVRSVGRWMAHSFVARIGNWRGRAVIVWASSGMEEHAGGSILTHGEVPAGDGPSDFWRNVHRWGTLLLVTILRRIAVL